MHLAEHPNLRQSGLLQMMIGGSIIPQASLHVAHVRKLHQAMQTIGEITIQKLGQNDKLRQVVHIIAHLQLTKASFLMKGGMSCQRKYSVQDFC